MKISDQPTSKFSPVAMECFQDPMADSMSSALNRLIHPLISRLSSWVRPVKLYLGEERRVVRFPQFPGDISDPTVTLDLPLPIEEVYISLFVRSKTNLRHNTDQQKFASALLLPVEGARLHSTYLR